MEQELHVQPDKKISLDISKLWIMVFMAILLSSCSTVIIPGEYFSSKEPLVYERYSYVFEDKTNFRYKKTSDVPPFNQTGFGRYKISESELLLQYNIASKPQKENRQRFEETNAFYFKVDEIKSPTSHSTNKKRLSEFNIEIIIYGDMRSEIHHRKISSAEIGFEVNYSTEINPKEITIRMFGLSGSIYLRDGDSSTMNFSLIDGMIYINGRSEEKHELKIRGKALWLDGNKLYRSSKIKN